MAKNPYSYHQAKLQELLRKVRTKAGLRQEDVAQRLGVPQSFISKYESGERRLDFVEVRQVCEALGISLADFVRLFEEFSE
ncbi:MAG TPA: transcriptional regulator [Phycisphaerales bacterium]|nr:transcriptional regulator [Phycisphaerales bacterium]